MKRTVFTINFVVVIILTAMFTSCQVSRSYTPPVVDTKDLFRYEYSSDTVTIADVPWQRYFTDPFLRDLITEALTFNYDMNIAYARIAQAEANLRIARSAYFPNVALTGQVTHTRTSMGEVGKDVLGYGNTTYSLGIAASWEADIWGRLSRQSRAQYAQFLNSHAYRALIQTSLIANIATTYYTLLALDEQLRITEETIALLRESNETMQALMEAGVLNGASVEQSRSLYLGTLISVPDLKSRIRETENSLSVLVGRKPGPITRTTIDEQILDIRMYYGVPVQLLSKRPDVLQAEYNFRAAFELTAAARASLYPSVTLGNGSTFGLTATELSGFFKPENILANIIGGITLPIFAQGQLRGNVRIAQAQQQEALLNFEKAVLSAGQEVSDILFSFRSSLSKNSIRLEQIKSLRTSVYFTQELLKAGEANYTEVLTAEQNLLSAQLNRVNDRLEQLQYSVNLYKALGGGWE